MFIKNNLREEMWWCNLIDNGANSGAVIADVVGLELVNFVEGPNHVPNMDAPPIILIDAAHGAGNAPVVAAIHQEVPLHVEPGVEHMHIMGGG